MVLATEYNATTRTEVLCKACGGRMKKTVIPKHNRKFGAALIAGGVGCSLFWVGLVLGIPLAAMGAYMATAKKPVWICSECQSMIDRYVAETNPLSR